MVAQVELDHDRVSFISMILIGDILEDCEVNNGGCDVNAKCSHDPKTYAVQCTCKTGYVNTGVGSVVVCKGRSFIL